MSTELQTQTDPHNHPPRCCCPNEINRVGRWHQDGEDDAHELFQCDDDCRCPACPVHGTKPDPIECPQCRQPVGRPHTEFCTLAPGNVWNGIL
ncbi:hypothetical protein ACXJJ3_26710 [Kribbella sp. WER1]